MVLQRSFYKLHRRTYSFREVFLTHARDMSQSEIGEKAYCDSAERQTEGARHGLPIKHENDVLESSLPRKLFDNLSADLRRRKILSFLELISHQCFIDAGRTMSRMV